MLATTLHYPRVLYTRVYRATVVCTLRYLALTLTHLAHCARARLLIYFDVSLRKLRARAYSSLDPFPHPAQPPRFLVVTRAAPMAAGNSRNFTFESYASAALCGSSSAASGDNFGRISTNLRGGIKATLTSKTCALNTSTEFGRNSPE